MTSILWMVLWAADPWVAVADRLIQMPPEAFAYNWGEGVQQLGLMKTWEVTRDRRYLDWMRRWVALYQDKPVTELLNSPKEHRGFCGHWSPAAAIQILQRASPRAEYRRMVDATLAFIRDGAERSPEGALGHWQGSHQLWVDTLYMACPVLAGSGDLGAVRDAARQITLFAGHLQDERTGLFIHMWDWQTGERSTGPWGRGNGWVLMALADVWEASPAPDPALRAVLARLVRGLEATQDPSGLWHTVMDDPASYVECSASAMVVYGVYKLVRLGALPGAKLAMARKAWAEINRRFVRDGLVTGVSAGTVPKGRAYYGQLPAGTETWGTGAYLLAGSEVARAPRR